MIETTPRALEAAIKRFKLKEGKSAPITIEGLEEIIKEDTQVVSKGKHSRRKKRTTKFGN